MIRCLVLGCMLLVALVAHGAPAAPELQWTRAIDRDDATSLWALMPTVEITIGNEKGKTALMAAAKLGDRKMLDALIHRGAALQRRSKTGGTVLMYAVLGNNIEMVRYLFALDDVEQSTTMIDAQSTNGWTAAMIAAAKGFDQVLGLLVEQNADPWLADGYGWSPLMRAIDNRHRNVVRYLLGLPDVSLNKQNENGSTALHVAVLTGDVESVRLLLKRGADQMIRDKANRSALDIATEMKLTGLIAALGEGK